MKINGAKSNYNERINDLKPWYYLVKICEDIYTTPPDLWDKYKFSLTHQHYIARMLKYVFKYFISDPRQMTALDYGCNCGWLSFMLAVRFKYVLGYDVYQKYIDQANF
jgi:2-polyprenyl-3-methyl-5-hydroxy-6-metoxy-1,4-benzoquinol methylase